MEQEARKQFSALDVKREALETERDGIVSELKAPPEGGGEPMGIDTPFVDKEGYPRGDIDIYRARVLRGRLAEIRTDHKALMKQIEEVMVKLAAFGNPAKVEEEKAELAKRSAEKPKPKFDAKTGKWVVMNWDGSVAGVSGGEQRSFHELDREDEQTGFAALTRDMNRVTTTVVEEPMELVPFARINFVAPLSPAAEACMEENDLVLDFGGINHTNHKDMTAIGDLVPHVAANNEEVEVQILRDGSKLFLKLKPKPWHGRGLLGCHIVKYE